MLQEFPGDNLLAEPLYKALSGLGHARGLRSTTYADRLLQVTLYVYPYDFHGDIAFAMLPLPYVRKPTMICRVGCAIIRNANFGGSGKKSVVAAYPVQSPDTFHSVPQRKIELK